MSSYVSLLEEKVRQLEEKQNARPASAGSLEDHSGNISPIGRSGQDQIGSDQRPLSPASLNDGVLDLENSGAFELLEFGCTRHFMF
jgi:hypothetical protein